MDYKNVIGIDPGKSGGVVCLNSNNTLNYYKFIPKIGNNIDIRDLSKIFSLSSIKDTIVLIEQVHALFGSSAGSTFDFGKTCGIIEGVISTLGFSYIMIKSCEWQKDCFQGIPAIYKSSKKKGKGTLETKKMAELAYKRLYPDIDFYLTENGNKSKNVHDGLVDALLIASYGLRKFCK